jgi:uncharacterized protein YecT (DUF1311 family)
VQDPIPASELVILLQGKTKQVRLGSRAKWLKAIELGDLAPDTVVEILTGGGSRTAIAYDVPELRSVFDEMGQAPSSDQAVVTTSGTDETPTSHASPLGSAETGEEIDDPDEAGAQDTLLETDDTSEVAKSKRSAWPARLGGGAIALLVLLAIVKMAVGPGGPASSSTAPPPPADVVQSVPPAELVSMGATMNWESSKGPDPKTYQFDNIRISFSAKPVEDGNYAPVVTLQRSDEPAVELVGDAWSSNAQASASVVRVDAATRTPAILVTYYTGGAHCCTRAILVRTDGAMLASADLGTSNNGVGVKDLDSDGVGEIISSDERFLYTFASYAESFAPPWVQVIQNGAVEEANDRPAFRRAFEESLPDAQKACLSHNNGGCAAFVAIAARVGRAQWAWDLMIENYDREHEWDYPKGCSTLLVGGQCPTGYEVSYPDFPTALAAFLTETGYGPMTELQPVEEAVTAPVGQPSFDCSRADNAVLRLICSTPALAEADVRLEAAYGEAMVSTRDAPRLRGEQRDWINMRNSGPADVERLSRLYEARIAFLLTDGRQ